MNLMQIANKEGGRQVAAVEGDAAHLLDRKQSIYEMAVAALARGRSLLDEINESKAVAKLPLEAIHDPASGWRILPCFDHPDEPARCLVAGTGLTHLRSAQLRQNMHAGPSEQQSPPTDSMRMYQWGVEGGRPAAGAIGAAPEWFFKGNGHILRGHGAPLDVPAHSGDGGEEAELVGLYLIDPEGMPRRVGMAQGNEFSDHLTEEKNYLYLASSKLRSCAIGPELVLNPPFDDVEGRVRILRCDRVAWESSLRSGDRNMCHNLANMEHHHFKHPQHRRPGDVHIYFFGADSFSFQERLLLQEGDRVEIAWQGFGRPLMNPITFSKQTETLVKVTPL